MRSGREAEGAPILARRMERPSRALVGSGAEKPPAVLLIGMEPAAVLNIGAERKRAPLWKNGLPVE